MSHPFKQWTYIANGDANSFSIETDGRWIVYLLNGEMLPAQQEGIMRRICACMNACAQITTDEMENIAATGGMLGPREDVASIARQRDELLAALKDAGFILDMLRTASNGEKRLYAKSFAGSTVHVSPVIKGIESAIAKAEAQS